MFGEPLHGTLREASGTGSPGTGQVTPANVQRGIPFGGCGTLGQGVPFSEEPSPMATDLLIASLEFILARASGCVLTS